MGSVFGAAVCEYSSATSRPYQIKALSLKVAGLVYSCLLTTRLPSRSRYLEVINNSDHQHFSFALNFCSDL